MFKFSQQSLNKLNTVDPQLQILAHEVLKISPYDFAITEGLRTLEKQQELFKQNKPNKIITKCDGINNKSKHQEGKAIDIMIYIQEIDKTDKTDKTTTNKPTGRIIGTWEEKYYREIATIFKQKAKELNINIRWGGDFKGFFDGPHFELI